MTDVWVCQEKLWVKGKLLHTKNETCHVKINNDTIEINSEYIYNQAYEDPLDTEDLIKLSHLNEPSILNTLKQRYVNDKIYTDTGPVLIAINPFKNLSIYTENNRKKYKGTTDTDSLDSHVYKIAQKALYKLSYNKRSQTILASGESGSGKTVTTKHILLYLTSVSDSKAHIKDTIIFSNPLMEAFGNAKTIHNDNSSRFGKFIQLYMNSESKISSGIIKTYLLEKIRVIKQNCGERNFHIFYQLLSSDKKNKYGLSSINDYTILCNKDHNSASLDFESDSKNFSQVLEAFDIMNFTEEDIDAIFLTIALILNLGNFIFTCEKDFTYIAENFNTQEVLRLSKWTMDDLTDFFCHEYMSIGGENIKKNLNRETTYVKLHTFIQELYQLLFDFISTKININLKNNSDTSTNFDNFIGILDIFGFEIFKNNSLEQLHINYTNESLQQIFNKNIFKTEQEEYIRENINWELIEYIDNIDRLKEIDGKVSIFSYLDEECIVPKGNDSSLLNKLEKGMNYLTMKHLDKANGYFTFSHYAGDVKYNIHSFVHKNKYHTNSTTMSFLKKADIIDFAFFKNCCTKKNKTTISASFKIQLQDLVRAISQTENYFVRCIKPNETNTNNFNISRVRTQLRYGGLTEAVRVVQAGFPIKLSHTYFKDKYYPLTLKRDIDFNDFKTTFLKEEKFMQIGKTKIFMKQDIYETLEKLRRNKMMKSSVIIQSLFRTLICRTRFLATKKSVLFIQSVFRGNIARNYVTDIKKCKSITKLQSQVRMYIVRKKFNYTVKQSILIQKAYKTYRYNKHLKTLQLHTLYIISTLAHIRLLANTIKVQTWYRRIIKIENNKVLSLHKLLSEEREKVKLLKEQRYHYEEEKNRYNEQQKMFNEEQYVSHMYNEEREQELALYKIKHKKLMIDLQYEVDNKTQSENDFQDTLKVNGSLIVRMKQLLDENEQGANKYYKILQENEKMRKQLSHINHPQPIKKGFWSKLFNR